MGQDKQTKQKISRRKKGIVVSNKADKTVVVEVSTLKSHKKYLKKYKSTKRYSVHDEKNEHKVGEVVFFEECRPMSQHTLLSGIPRALIVVTEKIIAGVIAKPTDWAGRFLQNFYPFLLSDP